MRKKTNHTRKALAAYDKALPGRFKRVKQAKTPEEIAACEAEDVKAREAVARAVCKDSPGMTLEEAMKLSVIELWKIAE